MMAEVLESRAASDAANPRRCPQTDRAGHPGECATDGTVLKPCTALGDEECVGATQRTEIVTPFCVVSEGRACGVFDWDEARLSELRLTNRQYSALEIHVGSVESQRLPRPQTGSCKEPDKRDMGQCPQARGRGQSSGLCHEPPDLIISEDMRFVALATGFEYPSGRNLRSWVERAQPSGESSHHAEPSCPCGPLHTFGFLRPTEGEFHGDELRSFALEELHEVTKRYGRFPKLTAEGTANCHVLCEGIAKGTHRSPPVAGQGRATPRSASKATFA